MNLLPVVTFCCDVYNKNEKTGRIEIVDGKVVKNEKYTEDMFKYPFPVTNNLLVLHSCLTERVICPDRFTPEVQKALGLTEYNIYDILRVTHGADTDDFIWFKFDGENITWDDVKVRN